MMQIDQVAPNSSMGKTSQGPIHWSGATLVDSEQELQSGSIVTNGPQIVAVGETQEIRLRFPECVEIDCQEYLIFPGLINAHTHAALNFLRDLGHGRENVIETLMFPLESKLTEELLEGLSYPYLVEGVQSGVTCFVDHYYFESGTAQALQKLGLKGALAETVGDLGTAFPDASRWDWSRSQIENWKWGSAITPVVGPHASDTTSPSLLKKVADFARQKNVSLHMHLSQTEKERKTVLKKYGKTPVQLTAEAGALGPRTLLAHLVSAEGDDFKILADSGAVAVFCPSAQVIYEKAAPIAEFIRHQIPVALATDSTCCNDSADLLAEMRICALMILDRLGSTQETVDIPRFVLDAVTTVPSKALGREDLGRLRAGCRADLVFMKKDVAGAPWVHPRHHLVFSASSRQIKHVLCEGKWVLWEGASVQVSETQMKASFQDAYDEIWKRVGTVPQSSSS